jgi:hypothetical protein
VFSSLFVNQKGQYPNVSFAKMGLPVQDQGTGAPGSDPPSDAVDVGFVNEPGQYPKSWAMGENIEMMPLVQSTGAPGSEGAPTIYENDETKGTDSVSFSAFSSGYKGEHDPGGMNRNGDLQGVVSTNLTNTTDWTQANPYSYSGPLQMPSTVGNTPRPGSGQFQTQDDPGSRIRRGGFTRGDR